MIKSIGLLWFLLYASLGWAVTIQDFAWRAPLSVSDGEIQRVEIPLDVMLAVTRSDLGDIAVFDKNGNLLPGWLRKKQPEIEQQKIELTFHHFSYYESGQQLSVTTRETTTDDKRITEYQMRGNVPIKQRKLIYMIELTDQQMKKGIAEIDLEWTHQPAEQLLSLRVEVGNNLDTWRVAYHRKNLFKGGREKRDWSRIGNIPTGYRYIRLIPSKVVDTFDLKEVTGFYQEKSPIKDLIYTVGTLQKDPIHPEYYHFVQPSAYPAQSFELTPAVQGIVKGDLYASHDDFSSKRLIKRNLSQFNIAPSESIVRNSPIMIDHVAKKHWWFKPDQPSDRDVILKWFYLQYEYLFLSNGNQPYYLAWGNFEVGVPVNDLKHLLKEEKRSQQVMSSLLKLGKKERSGGFARLNPEEKLPWTKWVLWLALVSGVIVMARMAWRLYRDMSR